MSVLGENTRPGPTEGWSVYMRDWRDEHPTAVIENRLRERARSRAKSLLKELHPDEYEVLYEEALHDVRMEYAAEASEGRPAVEYDTLHGRKHRRANVQRKQVRALTALVAQLPAEAVGEV